MRKEVMFMLLERANQVKELAELAASYTALDGVTQESVANGDVDNIINDGSLFEDSYSHTFNPNRFQHPDQQASFYDAAFWGTNLTETESTDIENLQSLEANLRDATETFFKDGDSFSKNWTWDDYPTVYPMAEALPDGIISPDTINLETAVPSPSEIAAGLPDGIVLVTPDGASPGGAAPGGIGGLGPDDD